MADNGDGTRTYTRRQRERFVFSGSRLVKVIDLNGYFTTLGYDGAGRLVSLTDSVGHTVALLYGADNRIASVTDNAGRQTSYLYNAAGNLTTFIDVNGNDSVYGYDSSHRMLTMGDARGGVVTNRYDSVGRVDLQTDPLGRPTTFLYGDSATVITNPDGDGERQSYDDNGALVALTKGAGSGQESTWAFVYDQSTLTRTRMIDPNDNHTVYVHDAAGNLTSTTDPLGRTSTASYNGLNLPTTITDADGVTTTITYDAAGNLLTTSRPLLGAGGAVIATRTTTLRYHENGNPNNGEVTSMIDPDAKVWTFGYDDYGLLDSVTDPLGNRSTSTFDMVGRMLSSTTARGNQSGAIAEQFTTHYGFDPDGLVIAITDALDKTSLRSYDPNRNLGSSTDAEGNETTYIHNAADELIGVERADTTTLAYDYHPDGSLHRQIDGDGQDTVYEYDAQGRLASTTDPLNRTTTFGYDPAGNVVTKADPGGTCPAWPITYPPTMAPGAACTVSKYNAANELVGIDYSDPATPDVTLTYDSLGRRATMAEAAITSTWNYDSLGRLTGSSNTGTGLPAGSQTTTYGYDLRGNVTKIRYPGLSTDLTRTFDASGRLDEIRDWNNDLVGNFDYDPDGNPWGSTLGNGLQEATDFDRAGRPEAMYTVDDPELLTGFGYTRDDNGQVESTISVGARHLGLDDHSYSYSALNQLEGLDSDAGAFDHDPADNLIERHRGRSIAHDDANQLLSVSVDLPVPYWGGVIGDKLMPADYGGDGIADLGVFRPSEAIWYLKDSAAGAESGTYWGTPVDTAVPGDYDGDGIDDTAVFRSSENIWYLKKSSNGAESGVYWGAAGDKPVPADYDGDNKTDLATFRPSENVWYVKTATTETGTYWGAAGDIAVPADYDGDNKADLATFRPSSATWYIRYSSGIASSSTSWGTSGDIAVPADYDGDGKADLGVFRPSDGTWRIKYSSGIASSVTQWGANGDIPTPGDHDGDDKSRPGHLPAVVEHLVPEVLHQRFRGRHPLGRRR